MKSTITVILILLVGMILLSGCEVYTTLYGANSEDTETVYVPDTQMVVQGEVEETPEESEESLLDIVEMIEETLEEEASEDSMEDITGMATEEVEEIMEEVDEEPMMEEQDVNAIIVQESERVSLVPEAEDPDGDNLLFTFTSPLNENGEWQTTYGDAGEYTVTITVSDGELTSTQDVLLIVNKKEESPTIESFSPVSTVVEMDETDATEFSVAAFDLNKDPLNYEWKIDGVEVGDRNSYTYQTTYDDAGSHTVKVDVSDGTSTTSNIWAVNVGNLNRLPVLGFVDDLVVNENDLVTLEAAASDEDGDSLSFTISDDHFTQDGSTFTWQTTYDDAGVYTFTITVDDGTDTIEQEVSVTVNNVNRKPVIMNIFQKS